MTANFWYITSIYTFVCDVCVQRSFFFTNCSGLLLFCGIFSIIKIVKCVDPSNEDFELNVFIYTANNVLYLPINVVKCRIHYKKYAMLMIQTLNKTLVVCVGLKEHYFLHVSQRDVNKTIKETHYWMQIRGIHYSRRECFFRLTKKFHCQLLAPYNYWTGLSIHRIFTWNVFCSWIERLASFKAMVFSVLNFKNWHLFFN